MIDGVRRRINEERTRQLVSPRRMQPWAKSYKDRAERLIDDGLMQPSGQAGVDRARASGAWDAMNDVDALVCRRRSRHAQGRWPHDRWSNSERPCGGPVGPQS